MKVELSLAHALGGLAALLAVGALLVREPATARRASVDLAALAKDVEHGADHVGVPELRALVAQHKVRVIDLRSPDEFAHGHIDGAENVPLSALSGLAVRRDEAIVLYSEGGIHSSQAWFLLRARGVSKVRFLKGGYDEWLDPDGSATDRDREQNGAPTTTSAVVDAGAPSPATPVVATTVEPRAPRVRPKAPARTAAAPPAEAPSPEPVSPPPAPAPPPKKPREGC